MLNIIIMLKFTSERIPKIKMFRKIISNLPFSPALVGKLGVLARHLKREELSRRLGLVFVVLTLIIQSLAVLRPPESANAGGNLFSPGNIEVTCPKNTPYCQSDVKKSISATLLSQDFKKITGESSLVAYPGDQILYTLTTENNSMRTLSVQVNANLADVLEYSEIIDIGEGSLNKSSKLLSWSAYSLDPGQDQTRSIVVKVLDNIPATARGTNNTSSYDCRIQNVFGNTISIGINCPEIKMLETITNQLPKVDAVINITCGLSLLIIAFYYYSRVRLLEKEMRIIRKNNNSGTI